MSIYLCSIHCLFIWFWFRFSFFAFLHSFVYAAWLPVWLRLILVYFILSHSVFLSPTYCVFPCFPVLVTESWRWWYWCPRWWLPPFRVLCFPRVFGSFLRVIVWVWNTCDRGDLSLFLWDPSTHSLTLSPTGKPQPPPCSFSPFWI